MHSKSIDNLTQASPNAGLSTYQAGVLQATVNRSLQKYSDLSLQPFGITKTQWMVVGTVLDAGPDGIRLSDVAAQLDTTLSYLTNVTNLLESKNILTRTASSDNRAKLVRVHPDFLPLCEVIEFRLRSDLRSLIYSQISQEDFKTYIRVLHKLATNPDL